MIQIFNDLTIVATLHATSQTISFEKNFADLKEWIIFVDTNIN